MRNIVEAIFSEEGTEAGNDFFEGGFNFSASEARNEFYRADSSDWREIVKNMEKYQGVREERAVDQSLYI